MIDQVRPTDLAAWFAQDSDAAPVLLDVREPVEWQSASVAPAGFTLVRMSMHEVPARLAELNADQQRIACLCHHGGRSQQVALFLQHHGFARVANVVGGIDAWSLTLDPAVPRY